MNTIAFAIGVIGFVVGLPQSWGSNWKEIYLYYYKGIVSWKAVHKAALKVIKNLNKDQFRPNVIVGIGRGGAICAGILCSEIMSDLLFESQDTGVTKSDLKLGVINSTIFFKQAYPVSAKNALVTRIDKIELGELSMKLSQNDKILLVIAQHFTGSSLEKAIQKLKDQIGRDNIKTVAFFWHQNEHVRVTHDPDIIGEVIPVGKTMPWKSPIKSTDRF